ncbi:unnamed protein product [Citrullus colocynthis]|uniref:Uncharacterized protein n=1 Tax=Citrullus colocynthis TaxID=252529 RepID=A0ABP0YR51_9ROSI
MVCYGINGFSRPLLTSKDYGKQVKEKGALWNLSHTSCRGNRTLIFRITMWLQAPFLRHNIVPSPAPSPIAATFFTAPSPISTFRPSHSSLRLRFRTRRRRVSVLATAVPNQRPLDLTEENVRHALGEARVELAQIFDGSVGITGVVELAELDGPFVKISLKGRFWHKRSTVVARVGNYLKNRIPEILEVEIEDESQLDDSPASF